MLREYQSKECLNYPDRVIGLPPGNPHDLSEMVFFPQTSRPGLEPGSNAPEALRISATLSRLLYVWL